MITYVKIVDMFKPVSQATKYCSPEQYVKIVLTLNMLKGNQVNFQEENFIHVDLKTN